MLKLRYRFVWNGPTNDEFDSGNDGSVKISLIGIFQLHTSVNVHG